MAGNAAQKGNLEDTAGPLRMAPQARRGSVTHMHCCAVLDVDWRCTCQLLSLKSPIKGVMLTQHSRCCTVLVAANSSSIVPLRVMAG